jgi:hypothetical protein
VVRDGEWHSAQPILLNNAAPFLVESVCGAGAGGAERRAKAAKFTTSDDMSDAVPVGLPEGSSRLVASSVREQ